METGRFLVLSTAHIRCSTGALLTEWAHLEPAAHPLLVASTYHGWFVGTHPLPAGQGGDLPDELPDILEFGRVHGCDYILLDSDGPIEDGLPTFPW